MPATVKAGLSTSTSFGPESVVRMPVAACAAEVSERDREATSSGIPASIGRHRQPVADQARRADEHLVAPRTRGRSATRRHIRSASARPRPPVAALALPLLTSTAADRPPLATEVCTADEDRGRRRLVGGEGRGRRHRCAILGRHKGQVERAGRLDPGGQPDATNPCGEVMVTDTTPASGSPVTSGRPSARLAHWTACPDAPFIRLSRAAERDHPAGPRVDPPADLRRNWIHWSPWSRAALRSPSRMAPPHTGPPGPRADLQSSGTRHRRTPSARNRWRGCPGPSGRGGA